MFPESRPNEELYYTQPGWPLEKRNAAVRVSARKGRLGFSLKDTPLTIKARSAAKHGMSVEEYERYSDPFSPSRIALLTATGAEAAAAPGAPPREVEEALELALPGARLPDRPEAKAVALRLATGDGLSGAEAGTFAAAVAAALSPAELALMESGPDAGELAARVAEYDAMIERYSRIAGKVRRDSGAIHFTHLQWEAAWWWGIRCCSAGVFAAGVF